MPLNRQLTDLGGTPLLWDSDTGTLVQDPTQGGTNTYGPGDVFRDPHNGDLYQLQPDGSLSLYRVGAPPQVPAGISPSTDAGTGATTTSSAGKSWTDDPRPSGGPIVTGGAAITPTGNPTQWGHQVVTWLSKASFVGGMPNGVLLALGYIGYTFMRQRRRRNPPTGGWDPAERRSRKPATVDVTKPHSGFCKRCGNVRMLNRQGLCRKCARLNRNPSRQSQRFIVNGPDFVGEYDVYDQELGRVAADRFRTLAQARRYAAIYNRGQRPRKNRYGYFETDRNPGKAARARRRESRLGTRLARSRRDWLGRMRREGLLDQPEWLEQRLERLQRRGVREARVGRVTYRLNPGRGPRVVYNRLLGGWYVVVGPHQTPLNGRFGSKAEALAWLRRRNPGKAARAARRAAQEVREIEHRAYGWATRRARGEHAGRWNRSHRRAHAKGYY